MIPLLDTPAAGRYKALLVDPPWLFKTHAKPGFNANGKGAEAHYDLMSHEELVRLPVQDVAAEAAWLIMWTTWPHLEEAFALAKAWSSPSNPWTYRSGGAWGKRPRGWRGDPDKWQFGTGYIFRSASEPLLVFGRGWSPWRGEGERNLWIEPIRAHSEKPESVRDMVRRATDGPRLEMFARSYAEGFHSWGREVGKLD